jgi:WD40 repeat protein
MRSAGRPAPAPWAVGDVVAGQYLVTEVHTQGGMGLVYRVRHRRWDVDLAVKCPRAELFRSEEQKRLFVREAETWVSLGLHPNVCGCHYVRVLDGIPRVFAEYIPGGSLRDRIDDRQLYAGGPAEALARILDLSIQTAWGLGHAHERGLVHQDVKPANVLLDADGTAKVTDFGLARARTAGSDGLVPSHGMTVVYASPEQMASTRLGHRSDIYSFAVSVLEMFTGEVTWLLGPVAGEALAAHRTRGRGPDPHRDGLPDMPDAVAGLLARCLSETPQTRPGSMAEVAAELAAVYGQVTGAPYARPEPRAAELRADELNNRALSLLDLGRTQEAGEAFSAALTVDPRHPEATYNASLVRWRRGAATDEDVLRALDAARADAPDPGRVRPLLDEVHRERGAFGPGAVPGIREVPWYVYEEWSDPMFGGARRAEPGIEVRATRDGRRALTACDGTVRLWDLGSGRCLRELDGLRHAVDIGPDGRQAAGVGSDGLVRLWDLTDGRCLQTFTPYYRSGSTTVHTLRLLTGAGLVTAGTSDGTVVAWELATGRVRYSVQGFVGAALEASADGRLLLFSGPDGLVCLRDPERSGEQALLPARSALPIPVSLAGDGRVAAAVLHGQGIRLWALETGDLMRTVEGTADCLDLSRDGKFLAGGDQDGGVRLWETATGRLLRTFRGHQGDVASVLFLDDGRHLLTAGRDGTARTWLLPEPYTAAPRLSRPRRHAELSSLRSRAAELVTEAEQARREGRCADALTLLTRARTIPGHERAPAALTAWRALAGDPRITRTGLGAAWPTRVVARFGSAAGALALSADGRMAAVRLDDTLHLLDVDSGARGPVIEGLPKAWGKVVRFSADGRTVLTASQDGSLDAWSVRTGGRLVSLRLTLGAGAARFSADGRVALVRGADDRVSLWEMESGARLRTLDGDHGPRPQLWLAPDGRTAATSAPGHTVRLWDLEDGRCRQVLHGGAGSVGAIDADGEGRLLLSCGGRQDPAIRLWDTATGNCLRVFEEQPSDARDVQLTADGCFALSRGSDAALRVWEVATGRCLRVLHGRRGGFSDAVLHPDGCSALLAAADGSMELWELDWTLAARTAAGPPTDDQDDDDNEGDHRAVRP